MTSPLVSTDWLAARLDAPDVKIVDASWYMPQMDRDPLAEFEAAHIPGAVHFNLDRIADTSSDLPHMLADAATFSAAVGAMGISETDTIVVYDGMGLFSAPRVWWNFRVMGARNTFVLAGGLPKWQAEGHPVETGVARPAPAQFKAEPRENVTADAETMLAISQSTDGPQIVDMRGAARYRGEAPEPRAGLRSGRIPGSLNLPFNELVVDGTLVDDAALKARLEAAGIDLARPVISSCGSGVTATFLNLALAQLGVDAMQIYDGSWTEWGGNPDLPIERG